MKRNNSSSQERSQSYFHSRDHDPEPTDMSKFYTERTPKFTQDLADVSFGCATNKLTLL